MKSSAFSEPTDEVTKEDIWSYRDEVIQLGFDLPEAAIIEALPATGKSYGSMKWAANTGNFVTLLAPRHSLLDDEYDPWCEDFDLTTKRLPSFQRDCPSFEKNEAGEYVPIDQSAEDLHSDYQQGFTGEKAHSLNPHSTCQQDGECHYIEKLDLDPTEYDVLLGTYRHAHVEDWIENRYVAFDEFPQSAFLTTFDGETEQKISAYLKDRDELPFNSYRDLLLRLTDDEVQDSIEAWKNKLHSSLSDQAHVRRSGSPSAHTLAPLATLAVIESEPLENDWWFSDLRKGRKAALNPETNDWTFLHPPDLSSAESVIGLDGTPNEALWKLALNEEIQSLALLNTEGKKKYLQDILGLRFIQTTTAWKAIQSGDGAAPPKDLALTESIARKETKSPALISSNKGITKYRRAGLDDLTKTVEYYGNLKGMNDFKTERLGLVLGNPHPGHNKIRKWCAFAGESAEPKVVDGETLRGGQTDYGPYGNRIMRTFIHDEVLQAGMRFGREEVNGNKGATVYLHTCAFPSWLPVDIQLASIDRWTGTQKNGIQLVISAVRDLDGWMEREWKVKEVTERIDQLERQGTLKEDLSDTSVRKWLKRLAKQGYLSTHQEGQGNAHHFSNNSLENAPEYGHVEFAT
jgi:hypothetical protein